MSSSLKFTGSFLPIFGDSIKSVGFNSINPEYINQLYRPLIEDRDLFIDEADIPLSNLTAKYEFKSDSEQLIRFLPLFNNHNSRCLRSKE